MTSVFSRRSVDFVENVADGGRLQLGPVAAITSSAVHQRYGGPLGDARF